MTAAPPSVPVDPLVPVREDLVARARAEAERLLTDADAEADAIVGRAQVEADTIRAEARAQGEADAAAVLVTERTRARRQARAVVLAAQRDSYDQLRARVVQAVPSLRGDPAYATWCDRVREGVLAELGEDAAVTEHPDGGMLGEVAGRRVAHSLVDLAELALDALGSDVEGLWST